MGGKAPWAGVKGDCKGRYHSSLLSKPLPSGKESKTFSEGYPVTGYFLSRSLSFITILQRTLGKALGPAPYRPSKAAHAPELYASFIKGAGDKPSLFLNFG